MDNAVIRNFGGNVEVRPQRYVSPASEQDVLAVLASHPQHLRVSGSRHAWSPLIETDSVLLVLDRLNSVQVIHSAGSTVVKAQGGCPLWKVLETLNDHGLTLPSVGLITAQTVAGAVSTGTHGSGRSSLSHFVREVRLACYEADGKTPRIVTIAGGPELRAARCSLGCLGVILEVTFSTVPQYHVQEQLLPVQGLEQALEQESAWPLQQFFLLPHLWKFYAQRRRVAPAGNRLLAELYRVYWSLCMDLGLHLLVLAAARVAASRRAVHLLFRRILPWFIFPRLVVTDRSDRQLVMQHDLFRHLEEELFVRREHLPEALLILEHVLRLADNPLHTLDAHVRSRLSDAGLLGQLEHLSGTWTHHYPICIRRVAPDDTLISMSAGTLEDWYAISLITYVQPREPFLQVAAFLAKALGRLCKARPHWGKWFPWQDAECVPEHPGMAEFRRIADRHDPRGVFRNAFVRQVLEAHQ
ncbi:MAG: FAD-binding protein [Planctomycetota bacterium]